MLESNYQANTEHGAQSANEIMTLLDPQAPLQGLAEKQSIARR